MVTVETLYGVDHGGSSSIAGLTQYNVEVYPSNGLISELYALPRGTIVGVETFDPADFSGKSITIGKGKSDAKEYGVAGGSYWDELLNICKETRLNVAYLDDFAIWQSHVEMKHEAKRIMTNHQRSVRRTERLLRPFDPQREMKAKLAAFKALTEANYVFHLDREGMMIENIVKYSPKVVILGSGHGDYMAQVPQEMRQKGIEVTNYKREVVDERMLEWSLFNVEEDRPIRAKLEQNGTPDPSILAEREAIIRQHRAVNDGRITGSGKPDYIGTWEVGCPPMGLFEVFIEGDNFEGRIEDTQGTAIFSGEVSKGEVFFAKNYNPENATKFATKRTLFYEGKFKNGQYEGEFSSPDRAYGKFTMRKYL